MEKEYESPKMTSYYHMEKDKDKGTILLRNMKVLEKTRPFLAPMKEKLTNAQP